MIEKFSWFLTYKILNNNRETSGKGADYEVIEYAIECIINTIIPFIFYLIYAIVHKILLSMIIWITTFLLLRNFIGGYHASSHFKCIFFSTIYGLFFLYVMTIPLSIHIRYKVIIFLALLIIHFLFEPIVHHEENKNQCYYKKTNLKIQLTLITFCILIVLFNTIIPSVSTAIFFGTISAELLFLISKPKLHTKNKKEAAAS